MLFSSWTCTKKKSSSRTRQINQQKVAQANWIYGIAGTKFQAKIYNTQRYTENSLCEQTSNFGLRKVGIELFDAETLQPKFSYNLSFE